MRKAFRDGEEKGEDVVVNTAAAAISFELCFITQNNGADTHITDGIKVDGMPAASKFIALDGEQFRIVSIPLTLEAGEHEISVCGLTATITVK